MTTTPFQASAAFNRASQARPDVLIADAGPLVYLAQVNALSVFQAVSSRIEMLDLVVDQALRTANAEGRSRLTAWLETGHAWDNRGPLWVTKTAAGQLAAVLTPARYDIQPQGDVPTMVAGWLALRLLNPSGPVLVLHADDCWARLAALAQSDQVYAMRLAAFLELVANQKKPAAPRRPWVHVA